MSTWQWFLLAVISVPSGRKAWFSVPSSASHMFPGDGPPFSLIGWEAQPTPAALWTRTLCGLEIYVPATFWLAQGRINLSPGRARRMRQDPGSGECGGLGDSWASWSLPCCQGYRGQTVQPTDLPSELNSGAATS